MPRLSRPGFALSTLTLALLPWAVQANQSLSISGYGLTVGPVFNRSHLGSAAYNPANAIRMLADDEYLRFGLVQAGTRYEIGQLDDVQKVADEAQADFKTAFSANSAAVAQELAHKINTNYIPRLEVGASMDLQGQTSVLTPILWRTDLMPGVWSLNATAQAQTGGRFKGDETQILLRFKSNSPGVPDAKLGVSVTNLADQVLALENAVTAQDQQAALQSLENFVASLDKDTLQTLVTSVSQGVTYTPSFAATTASAFDFKVAEVNQISLGYSGDASGLLPDLLRGWLPKAKLDVGMRVNVYQALLYRQLVALVDTDGNPNKIKITTDSNFNSSTAAVGVDLGALWNDEYYQFGATVYNLNSPRFEYPNPLQDPNPANAAAANRLYALGKLTVDDAVVLKPHVVVEASVHTSDKRWLLQGSAALNETTDLVGQAQQNVTVSASFNAERFERGWLDYVVPSVRVGYRQNLVGNKFQAFGLGFSWGIFNLDLYSSLQNVVADGVTVPRSAGLSLSIAEKF